MKEIRVSKIRPVSWKVYVQGKTEVEYVRTLLSHAGIHAAPTEPEPGLTDPPVYALLVTPDDESPLTSEELEAILEKDERVELAFEEK